VDQKELHKVRQALPDTPLLANTGVSIDTVAEIFSVTDGCIIGSHLKHNGDTWGAVDPERVRKFMDKVVTLR